MQLLAYTVLIYANSELQQATAFLHWLRSEIETQSTNTSSLDVENADKDAALDYPKILDYVRGALQDSPLSELFQIRSTIEGIPVWDIESEPDVIYPKYRAEVRERKEGRKPTRQLPSLKLLISRLDKQCRTVFRRTAEMQKRKVRVGELVPLEDGHSDCFDARMTVPASGSSKLHGYANEQSKAANDADLIHSVSFIALASADFRSGNAFSGSQTY